jgi:pilus assembly protein CpaF
MSDVEIPVYVSRAQVASAIHLVVQISRFVEDGSRKVTRITEAYGLDENNQYRTHDLFVSRMRGKTADGQIIAELEPTGQLPTFAAEVYEQGMENRVKLSQALWQPPGGV